MPVVSLERPPYGAKDIIWGVVPAQNRYRRDPARPFIFWPLVQMPALGLAGLAPLCLLLGEHLGIFRAGLCWLACWVFQQMFQLDALRRGSCYAALAYALLLVCVSFFHRAGALCFYILFEMSLLPTLFIVLLFGYQPEKLRAGQYLLLYTVLASLPLLLSLLTLPPFLA